jgi:hypothetical protein
MEQIAWTDSWQQGLTRATAENKLLFLDFFNPN